MGLVSDYGLETMKSTLEKAKQEHDSKNKAYFEEKEIIKEVNNQMTDEEKLAEEERIKKEAEFAAAEAKKEEPKEEETPKEDAAEGGKEEPNEEKPEEKPAEKKFMLAEYADLEKMAAFMAGEEFEADFSAEAGKEADVNFGMVVKCMFQKMCKMAEKFDAAEKDRDAYMAKMQEYEARFAEIEKQKFSMAVESLLQDEDISTFLSKDEIQTCREDSVNFSLDTISGWENKVKALAFTHTKGKKEKDTVVKYALPFNDESKGKSDLLFK
jgi:hypothetical protein